MTGDFTRDTFRPAKGFSLVRMQQGRVLMDADWNEQGDIARHRSRTTRYNVIGPCGFPEDNAGFELVTLGDDIAILPGRGYVGGTLIEATEGAEMDLVLLSGTGADTLYRVTRGPRPEPGQRLLPKGAVTERALAVTHVETNDDGLAIRLSDDLGVETATLSVLVSIAVQPHLPDVPMSEDSGPYLAYLDVWDRQIFSLEDAALRDVALGGPDTAGRDQVIWQVRLMQLAPFLEAGEISAPPSCKSFPVGWTPTIGDGARLAARAKAASAAANPCALPASGGYRSFKNHLYRVEIHNRGVIGTDEVTVKWSHDNAMHRARLLEVSNGALVVDDAGKDAATGFKTGDWLEVLDEARILDARPGFFVRLAEVVGERLGVTELLDPDTLNRLIKDELPDTDKLPATGQVRRWEGGRPVAVELDWMPLEDGVEIHLTAGRVETGAYWTIPCRTIPADIEWPRDPVSDHPEALLPEGIGHSYCALALLETDGNTWAVTEDCRHLFPPLTGLESFHCLAGEGQEVMANLTRPDSFVAFPTHLTAGVARGETPVAGRLVRFTLNTVDGTAQLGPEDGSQVSASPTEVILRTGSDGVASVRLEVRPGHPFVTVSAELLDSAVPDQADPAHLPILFTGFQSLASETAYDPSGCRFQSDEATGERPSRNVQDAIDRLCPRSRFAIETGDDQILQAGREAELPLSVSLFWGAVPMIGRRVQFAVQRGDVTLDLAVAEVGNDGIARTRLRAGQDVLADDGRVIVAVKPQDPPPGMLPESLEFHARFADAQSVYVSDEICPDVPPVDGPRSIDTILRHLCGNGGGSGNESAIRVTMASVIQPQGDEMPIVAYSNIRFTDLVGGIAVDTDRQFDPGSVKALPVGKVTMDLPYPPPDSRVGTFYGVDQADTQVPFRIETELAAEFTSADSPRRLLWLPDDRARQWLTLGARRMMNELSEFDIDFIEARIELYGHRIHDDTGETLRWLDGDLFLNAREPQGVVYRSGEGVRGGNLVLPFRLVV